MADQQLTNVFIKNFGTDMDHKTLTDLCNQFGEILSAKVMRDDSGRSKGFGFVSFQSHDAARKCIEELNGFLFEGHVLYASHAQKKEERAAELKKNFQTRTQNCNVFIKNLEANIDDERLRHEFRRFGNITSAKIMRDPGGRSKGFGFVCFSSPEEAARAVREMNGGVILSKVLYVGMAQRKEERQKQFAQSLPPRNQLEAGPRVAPAHSTGLQHHSIALPHTQTGAFPAGQVAPVRHQQRGPRPAHIYAGRQLNFSPLSSTVGPPLLRAPYTRPPPPQPSQPSPGVAIPVQQQVQVDTGRQIIELRRKKPNPPEPLTLIRVFADQPQVVRRILEGHLVYVLYETHKELAQEITSRLLRQCENPELLLMLQSRELLEKKVDAETQAMAIERKQQDDERAQAEQQIPTSQEIPNSTANLRKPLPPEPLTPSVVLSAQPNELKQLLGQHLHYTIFQTHKEVAAKITGMLLEMNNPDLLGLLHSRKALEKKVEEAVQVLMDYQKKKSLTRNIPV